MGAAQRSAGGSAAQQSCPWIPLLIATCASCVHGCQTPAADPSEIATLAAEYLTLPTTSDIGQDGAWSCCTVGPQEVFQECADEVTVWMVTSSMTCSGHDQPTNQHRGGPGPGASWPASTRTSNSCPAPCSGCVASRTSLRRSPRAAERPAPLL